MEDCLFSQVPNVRSPGHGVVIHGTFGMDFGVSQQDCGSHEKIPWVSNSWKPEGESFWMILGPNYLKHSISIYVYLESI